MNPSFERLMHKAMRLTQAGSLRKATAAIQAALGSKVFAPTPRTPASPPTPHPASDDVEVIDVEATVSACINRKR